MTDVEMTENCSETMLIKFNLLELNEPQSVPNEEGRPAAATVDNNITKRVLRRRVKPTQQASDKRRVSLKPQKNTDPDVAIKNIYLCKKFKRKPHNLETIYEEPKLNAENQMIYIGIKKLKRFVLFQPDNMGKVKKRQDKIKKYFGRRILKKKKGRKGLEILSEKLDALE